MTSSHDVSELKKLVLRLNECRNAYYNNNESLVSDLEYDNMMDRLQELEARTGVVLANSPTRTVGYEVRSALPKVKHDHPMLSLDKTKDVGVVSKFLSNKPALGMAKADGLTCTITYVDGKYVCAATRGDGIVGEDISHNIPVVKNVPMSIPVMGTVIVDGEIVISKQDFADIRELVVDGKGKKYKNSRNLAAGSVRLLNSSECAKRRVQFVAWKPIQGLECTYLSEGLQKLNSLGFTVVPFVQLQDNTRGTCKQAVTEIQAASESMGLPIDGCVFSFDDIEYSKSLGMTSHHLRSQLAFKFYDDLYETTVRRIDWTMGKTGALTPTAIFDTVEIDGTDVSRASLHNLTIMDALNVRKNCTARVFKANMIIPQIESTDDDGTEDFLIPSHCPICGGATVRVKDNDSEILKCDNSNCQGKLLGKLCTFVSKQGMDISGLGEQTLAQFIELGYLKDFVDIYWLKLRQNEIQELPGFGKSSVRKMLDSVEKSKLVALDRLIAAVSIDGVGLDTAKKISKYFEGSLNKFMYAVKSRFDFSALPGFGDRSNELIYKWFDANIDQFEELCELITIQQEEKQVALNTASPINGKTFCVTGTFEYPRKDIVKEIEACGGISVSGVTKKTQVLFVGDNAGSKLKKAQELGIQIVTEEEMRPWLRGEVNA